METKKITAVTSTEFKGYNYGNPWEAKATRLLTTVNRLRELCKEGHLRERVEKDGYGRWNIFEDSEGVIAQRYTDYTFGENTWDQFTIHRDIVVN